MDPFYIRVPYNDRLERFRVFPSSLPEGMDYLVAVQGADVRFRAGKDGRLQPTTEPEGVDRDLLQAIAAKIEDSH